MPEFLHIKSLSQLHDLLGNQQVNHPLISVVDLSDFAVPVEYLNQKIVNSFFTITFKSRSSQAHLFGRKEGDFEDGILFAQPPEQVFTISETVEKGYYEGWILFFHSDLIHSKELFKQIKNYTFFSYQANEALHISNSEKATLSKLIAQISEECNSRIDDYSNKILTSYIGLLLDLIQRYYGRQFITRQISVTGTVALFNQYLEDYFNSKENIPEALPTVNYFADKLNISPGYLSDLLKKNTGKSAQELIHYHLIEKAKDLLLRGDATIAEIAYDLGFEYPSYFSRIFKNKMGKTPLEFRKMN